jgi:hypothetical protein
MSTLRTFWDASTGVLWSLRAGNLDLPELEKLNAFLDSLEIPNGACVPIRFVSVTWNLPQFMTWQIERVREEGGNVAELRRLIQRTHAALERLFGSPCSSDSRYSEPFSPIAGLDDTAGGEDTGPKGPTRDDASLDRWIMELRDVWRQEDGLCAVLEGRFDAQVVARALATVGSVEIPREGCIPKALLTYLWDLPSYLERNVERVIEAGGSADDLRQAQTMIENELFRLFGGP